MESFQSPKARAFAEDLEELKENNAFDPRVRAFRDLFDLMAFYALQGLILLGLLFVLVFVGGPLAREQGWPNGAALVGFLAIVLAAAIALQVSFQGDNGRKRERWLRLQARAFMPIIVAGIAFAGGWYWRHANPPDQSRADAERAAFRACGQLPVCIQLANRLNAGNDVRQYIRDPKDP
ncbi:MAG: hypothetical protein O9342_16790 [Beijerinckiaceae bacterium]|nr:hypothetical protein [Beijerinckiaceae bacterium]